VSEGRGPWSRFKAALDAAGFHPSRRFGQNFLLDENMVRAIVRDAGVAAGDTVLEVGAGCGFLTHHLAAAGVKLTSVEVDRRLWAIATELCSGSGSVHIVRGDVLAGKQALNPEVRALLPDEGPWHVVANLPYSISAPLLVVLAALPNPPTSMTVLVQKEVAERIAAGPGVKAWGPLSIRLQLDHDVELVRRVGPELFWPRPRVDSAVLRLDRRQNPLAPSVRSALDSLVHVLFQRRRQALGRVLGEHVGDRAAAKGMLRELGIDPQRRAETLELAELASLAQALPPSQELGI
jgi:16S rRNA (adenine1518-N6/adenine1519-N6)-dimethyltransferase